MSIVRNFLPVCLVLLLSVISVREVTCEARLASFEKEQDVSASAPGNVDIDFHVSFTPSTAEVAKGHEHHHHHHRNHNKDQTAKPASNTKDKESNEGGHNATIEVYADSEFEGRSETLVVGKDECLNLSQAWNDKISSIDTKGRCILVWEHTDCNGKHARLRPANTYSSRNLHHVRMNDETSSLEFC